MKMKLKYIVPLCLAFVAVVTGCSKDKGNYDYSKVNKVTVTDTANLTTISRNPGDTLRLKPVITQTMGAGEANLSFEWKTYENNANTSYAMPEIFLTNNRNLELVIANPPYKLGANYKIEFKVTDKGTGISTVIIYNLYVANKYAQGLLLLEDINGKGDLSMILPPFNNEVVHHVYSGINATAPMGKPVKLELTPFTVTDGFSIDSKKIYLLSENSGLELNYLTMVKQWDYAYLFNVAPSVIKPAVLTWTSTSTTATLSASLGIGINDGKAYANLVGGFPGQKKWGQMLALPTGNYTYNMAPFVAGGTTYTSVVYDNLGQRFYNAGQTALQVIPATASTIFDMNNVGLTMLYMDSANVSREYNAIMKDGSNAPYYLRFKTVSTTAAPNITLIKTTMAAPNVTAMTAAVSSPLTPHIYYASAGKIYRYETTSNSTVEQVTLPATEQVTKMKVLKGTVNVLVVATWDGEQGRVYYYPIGSLGDITTSSIKFEGFGKIVDMAYKII
jgi:hypothetical protein